MSDSDPLLLVEGLSRSYGAHVVLRDLSLRLFRGESLSMVGASGSGKTTLLSILGLLLHADEGRLLLDGVDASRLEDRALSRLRNELIGHIFQATHVIGSLDVLENILVPARLSGRARELRPRALALLERLGLAERAHYLPHQLSLGQRRRVALARALILNPPLILADEPTNDLDPLRAAQVADFLLGLPAEGHALILVTHDPAFAGRAQRRYVLQEGRLQPFSAVA